MDISERKQLIQAGRGDQILDLIIKNIRLVNVYTGQIDPTDLGIYNGRIVTPNAQGYATKQELDGRGYYAIPGFIDTHVHIDSTLLTPENLASLIVPHGTTAMLADPMEISNVAEIHGLKSLLNSQHNLPYHIFLEVPSRVPTAPGLETTGGELGLAEVSEILIWKNTVSLGELDPSKVLGLKDEYLQKVHRALELGRICNGHTAGLTGKDLAAYACGGLSDDHECVDFQDALHRLQLGLAILIREGSSERNLEPILSGAISAGIDFSNFMFCTDDKHPTDIQAEGHLDYMVNKAIRLGVNPITAIQMATINAARHFRLDHLIGSLTPGRWANFILSPSLEQIDPEMVYFAGQKVAEAGQLTIPVSASDYPADLFHTVKVLRGKEPEAFQLKASDHQAKVWVIELIRDQIVNLQKSAMLKVTAGVVQPDIESDVLKLAVVERYGKNGGIGISFVKGFGFTNGAMASSVSHDHHNIVVVGTNDVDMAVCVKAIEEMQGGMVIAVDGVVLASLRLPIGGLMSDQLSGEVISKLKHLNEVYYSLGGSLASPLMTLSFISLPTVPELGLTDKGLIHVAQHCLISPFVEELS